MSRHFGCTEAGTICIRPANGRSGQMNGPSRLAVRTHAPAAPWAAAEAANRFPAIAAGQGGVTSANASLADQQPWPAIASAPGGPTSCRCRSLPPLPDVAIFTRVRVAANLDPNVPCR